MAVSVLRRSSTPIISCGSRCHLNALISAKMLVLITVIFEFRVLIPAINLDLSPRCLDNESGSCVVPPQCDNKLHFADGQGCLRFWVR